MSRHRYVSYPSLAGGRITTLDDIFDARSGRAYVAGLARASFSVNQPPMADLA